MSNIRTTKPNAGDKYFIRQVNGGYSTCIKGKPTDKYCDTLANCVGYADGAFNEELGLGFEKYHFNCNAEKFIERAIAAGLSVVNYPVPGGIMVWQKGATLDGSDGAGHVCICTWTDHPTKPTIAKTAESGYGSKAFWTATRTNANGKWGAGKDYKWRGCIVNPKIGMPVEPKPVDPTPEPKPQPIKPKFNIGEKVVVSGNLYKSSNATKASGSVKDKITTITKYAEQAKHPYNTTGDLGWMDEKDIKKYTEKPSTPKQIKHTVKDGENLSTIARKYDTTWQKIYEANKQVIGKNPNIVRAGQVLVINK